MCRMRAKTLDIYMKEWGMSYHCACGVSKRTAKAMDKHLVRCEKRMAKQRKKQEKGKK